ncbi:MAG TPA: hypothetical protein VG713_00255, partial [Pirellulales bacterium]|nr:hypothetical protein [Pirellulales bacterium]
MVLEAEPQQFFAWLPAALVHWLVIVATAGSLAFLIAALLVVLVGWREGFDRSVRHFVGRFGAVFRDLLSVAPRRVWALARLGWQESIRRRALVGFVLFLFVVLPMALWFLDTHSPDPAVLYVSSVQWSITLLVLVTVLLLAAVSLPTDLKNKTIFTVVTKPVRASELVLGRVLGIATIGTAMLAVMGPLAFA